MQEGGPERHMPPQAVTKKMDDARAMARKLRRFESFNGRRHIRGKIIKSRDMSAHAARQPVAPQVDAINAINFIFQKMRKMRVAAGMFAKTVDYKKRARTARSCAPAQGRCLKHARPASARIINTLAPKGRQSGQSRLRYR